MKHKQFKLEFSIGRPLANVVSLTEYRARKNQERLTKHNQFGLEFAIGRELYEGEARVFANLSDKQQKDLAGENCSEGYRHPRHGLLRDMTEDFLIMLHDDQR